MRPPLQITPYGQTVANLTDAYNACYLTHASTTLEQAYIAYFNPTKKVVGCTINQETKAFGDCVDAGGTNIQTPVSVVVNNGLVYINDQSLLNTAGEMITVCSQGADGTLINCAKTASYSAVKSTQGLAISGNYIYIGNTFVREPILRCTISGSTLINCVDAVRHFRSSVCPTLGSPLIVQYIIHIIPGGPTGFDPGAVLHRRQRRLPVRY